MIYKLQRPLNGPGPWMAYDRHRTETFLLTPEDLGPDVLKAMGEDEKGYFTGTVRRNKTRNRILTLVKRVSPQAW